ncbi:MAG: hypothetical protein MZV63_25385 [Marinilabiliales bacterium]|nr:hypothetical protein [Marinilabiliales bacterium]
MWFLYQQLRSTSISATVVLYYAMNNCKAQTNPLASCFVEKNGSKIWGMSSGAMPDPLSADINPDVVFISDFLSV